eukprot:143576-Hanusia_phi.AAC.1
MSTSRADVCPGLDIVLHDDSKLKVRSLPLPPVADQLVLPDRMQVDSSMIRVTCEGADGGHEPACLGCFPFLLSPSLRVSSPDLASSQLPFFLLVTLLSDAVYAGSLFVGPHELKTEEEMWIVSHYPYVKYRITVDMREPRQLKHICVWNYNGSIESTYR